MPSKQMKLLIAFLLFVTASAQISSVAPFGHTGGSCTRSKDCLVPCDLCGSGICAPGPDGHYSNSPGDTGIFYRMQGGVCQPVSYSFNEVSYAAALAECQSTTGAEIHCLSVLSVGSKDGLIASSVLNNDCRFRGVGFQPGCDSNTPYCSKEMTCVECLANEDCSSGICQDDICVPLSSTEEISSTVAVSSSDVLVSSSDSPVPSSDTANASSADAVVPPDDSDDTDIIVVSSVLGGLAFVVLVVALIKNRSRSRY